jgi:hypothetical protein
MKVHDVISQTFHLLGFREWELEIFENGFRAWELEIFDF